MTLRCRLLGHPKSARYSITRADGSYTAWCGRCGEVIEPRKPRGTREVLCAQCNATGRVVLIVFDKGDAVTAECPKCDGTGRVDA